MKLSPKISELIDSLKSLPGIGPKSAKRMALSLLSSNKEIGLLLAKSIEDAILNIQLCQKCYVLNDQELCEICNSANRNNNSICVVESTSDLYSIEETSEFDGRYFVLNGLLSPIDNIGAEELRIEKIIRSHRRIQFKRGHSCIELNIRRRGYCLFFIGKIKKERRDCYKNRTRSSGRRRLKLC